MDEEDDEYPKNGNVYRPVDMGHFVEPAESAILTALSEAREKVRRASGPYLRYRRPPYCTLVNKEKK